MDMNKSFALKWEDKKPVWRVIDAKDRVLGRLSTEIADALRGKDKPQYTPHADAGDSIVVINCEKIRLTGNKLKDKIYKRYSGYMGGLKKISAQDLLKKDPTALIRHSVKGMLPKNKLNRQIFKKLKIYAGDQHPHQAQIASK